MDGNPRDHHEYMDGNGSITGKSVRSILKSGQMKNHRPNSKALLSINWVGHGNQYQCIYSVIKKDGEA